MSSKHLQFKAICSEIIKSKKIKTVCDYGCGNGEFLDSLQKENPEVRFVGIDYFSKYDIIVIDNRNIEFLDKDIFDKNPEGYHFDMIVSTFALHHFQYPITEINKMCSSLLTNGYFLLIDHLFITSTRAKISKAISSFVGEIQSAVKGSYHRHHYTIDEVKDLFQAIPVKIESISLLNDPLSEEEINEDQSFFLEKNRKIQSLINQNSSDYMKSIWLPLFQLEEKLLVDDKVDYSDVFYVLAQK